MGNKKHAKRRRLFLDKDIDQSSVSKIVSRILQFNREDKGIDPLDRKPILLYITSHGGEVYPGFELIDVIQSSITPVYTINLGVQYSMAFLIGLAGHVRFTMPNATFLMHDGFWSISNSTMKVQDRVKFQSKFDQRTKSFVLSRSSITETEYDEKIRVEWYLFADEAKKKGFVDFIIGVDCDIDEVI